MGLVFKAHRDGDDRPVALKVLKRQLSGDFIFQQRFKHEARAAAEVHDRHLVAILESAEADGRHYLASDYVDGGSLDRPLRRPAARCRSRTSSASSPRSRRARRAARCGRHAPRHQAVERPLRQRGDAMLTDFGLAKGRAYTVLTRPGQVMGTLDYLAPELIRGQAGDAGDRHLRARLRRLRVRRRPGAVRRQERLPGRARPPRGAAARPGAERPELPAGVLGRDPDRAREGSRATARNRRRYANLLRTASEEETQRLTPALVFNEGPLAGRRVELDAELVLGREDASLTIDDEEISRRHAVIRPDGRRDRDRGPRLPQRDVRERRADRGRDPARRRRHGQARPERAPGRVGSRGRDRRRRRARAPGRSPPARAPPAGAALGRAAPPRRPVRRLRRREPSAAAASRAASSARSSSRSPSSSRRPWRS